MSSEFYQISVNKEGDRLKLTNKLNRLKKHMNHTKDSRQESIPSPQRPSINIPYQERWNELGVTPFFVDGNYCLVREVRYPLTTKHGKYLLSDFLLAANLWNETNVDHPLSIKGFSPADLFFFDTETTGLGGGVGNTIFLLGHARFMDDHVLLKQHLLPKPGSEVPLYSSFLNEVDYTTLVTYNGKAFDWPQVKTRHTLVRDHVPKLPSFGHFDLFHAARRLWKHKLDRLKLAIVEKEVLDLERKDDVPGFLAPILYFDFVERQDPDGIMGVLTHNEIDILSLITLYTHITFQLLGVDETQSARERFEIGRWFSYIGEHRASVEIFKEVAAGEEWEAFEAKWQLSLQLKKQKNFQECVDIWQSLSVLEDNKWGILSNIELAKWFEHKQKDKILALKYAEQAFRLVQKYKLSEEEIIKRIARLKNVT